MFPVAFSHAKKPGSSFFAGLAVAATARRRRDAKAKNEVKKWWRFGFMGRNLYCQNGDNNNQEKSIFLPSLSRKKLITVTPRVLARILTTFIDGLAVSFSSL